MDYVVLNGIRDRTGFEREELYLFVLKELLDNALDYVEKNHTEGCEIPELKVFIIRKSRDKDYLTLKVQNSDRNQASTSTTSVFTIETSRSSKSSTEESNAAELIFRSTELFCGHV
jgi:AAA15 family ATPase/GTPase